MREELLSLIEKNSKMSLKELAVLLGADELEIANEMEALEKRE